MNEHVSNILRAAVTKDYSSIFSLLDTIYDDSSSEKKIISEFEEYFLQFLSSLIKNNSDDINVKNVLIHTSQYVCKNENDFYTFLFLISSKGLDLNTFSSVYEGIKSSQTYTIFAGVEEKNNDSNASIGQIKSGILRHFVSEDNSYNVLKKLNIIDFSNRQNNVYFLNLVVKDFISYSNSLEFNKIIWEKDKRYNNILSFIRQSLKDYTIDFLIPFSESLVDNLQSQDTPLLNIFYEHSKELSSLKIIKIKMHLDLSFIYSKKKQDNSKIEFAKEIKTQLSKFILYNKLQKDNVALESINQKIIKDIKNKI